MIQISKKDILWGYIAQFFGIASGLIVLPLILHLLTPEEIGVNYLMLTVGSIVSLFDFGFSPQFGRNITYVFSGVQELKKEGLEVSNGRATINYRLLAGMIRTAKYVYSILGVIVLVVLLIFGTLYIYYVTRGFSNVNNILPIWILFSFSTFFNIYYSYLSSLLIGKGLIMENKKCLVYSKIIYIILAYLFLLFGWGLLSIVIANFVAPFISRHLSYKYFFTDELKNLINGFDIEKNEILSLFNIIWHNAKKLGLVFVGSYAVTKFGLFLSGLFLPLDQIASYGLMIQLVSIISTMASTLFYTYEPKFASLQVDTDKERLLKLFAYSMNLYYVIFIFGGISLLICGNELLAFIGSQTYLPTFSTLFMYLIISLLEGNHSNFTTLIVTKNEIPFVGASLISGFAITIGSFLSLSSTDLGIMGLVLVQGLVQVLYNNWKWPLQVCKEFQVSFVRYLAIGGAETFKKIKFLHSRYICFKL